jgi:cystathionine beta-lyase
LLQEPAIEEVMYPFLPSSEGHEHWRALCVSQERPEGRAAGIFSVRFNAKYSPQEVEGFCDRLKLFKLGYSWGGPVSLVVPYDIPSMRVKSAKRLGSGGVVRFCIGLENPNDLIEDLRQSLKAL